MTSARGMGGDHPRRAKRAKIAKRTQGSRRSFPDASTSHTKVVRSLGRTERISYRGLGFFATFALLA
jgi:hypothetical protein